MDAGRSPFNEMLGFERFSLTPDGGLALEVDVEPRHLNEGGIVHGGVLLSMMDTVLGGAVVLTLEEGEWTATQSLASDFLRAVTSGRIRAVGRVDRRGKLTAFVSAEVRDEAGNLVARASGAWAIRKG